MRLLPFLIALLLLPSVAAELDVVKGTSHVDATAFKAIVHDGEGNPLSHQNMAVRVEMDGRTWFTSDTLHEHDGIGTFTVGLDEIGRASCRERVC